MSIIKKLQAVLALLPILIQVIKAVEEAIPGQGKGEQKLQMIRGAVEGVYATFSQASISFEELWPSIQSLAKTVVSVFNATGQFKKETPANKEE